MFEDSNSVRSFCVSARTMFLGIDVGATWTRIAVADRNGSIVKKVRIPTPREGSELSLVEAIIEVLGKEFRSYMDRIEAVGIGSIGPLDLSTGSIVNPPNLPIKRIELGKPLLEHLRRPVYVANDCVAAVWGEYLYGLGKGLENVVYVTLSTGIGGGIIVDGNLLLGKKGNAHEIGHIVVDSLRRLRCGCGGYGHWEAYCGGANIPRFATYLIERWSLGTEEKRSKVYQQYLEGSIRTETIFDEAKRGDPLARKIVEEINRVNVAGFESVINLYDPELIVVGGSIALNNPELVLEPIKGIEYGRGALNEIPRIELTTFGDDVVLVGAIAIASNPPKNLVKKLRYLEQL